MEGERICAVCTGVYMGTYTCTYVLATQEKADLHQLLDDIRLTDGLVNGHSDNMKKWPVAMVSIHTVHHTCTCTYIHVLYVCTIIRMCSMYIYVHVYYACT